MKKIKNDADALRKLLIKNKTATMTELKSVLETDVK